VGQIAFTGGFALEKPHALGSVHLVQQAWDGPIDTLGVADEHRIELALLPARGARACFPEHWSANRFEPIGQLFLLPAGHAVRAKSDCRRQSSIVCKLRPAAVSAWFDSDLEWTDPRLQGSLDLASPIIRALLLRLGDEVRQPGFASDALIELISAQVAIELSRHCAGLTECKTAGGLPPWRLKLLDERLAEAMAAPTLPELAALCNLSVRQLTRAFRVSRGRSIGDYIAERRIENAKKLLAAERSVKAVAHTLGFATPSNFCTAFRRATGETPRQFRQRQRRT